MREAQKRKRLGMPLVTPLPSDSRKPTELYQTRFGFVKHQPEPGQPLRKFSLSIERIRANVSLSERAIVTARFANDVDDVNQ